MNKERIVDLLPKGWVKDYGRSGNCAWVRLMDVNELMEESHTEQAFLGEVYQSGT